MNLFVGVVINTFNDEKEKLGKNHLLTESQREWVMIQIACMKVKPLKQKETLHLNKIRKVIYDFANSFAFEIFILVCIVLNTLVLSIEWYEQPPNVNLILEIINYIFAAIFLIEALLKLIALGI